MNVVAEITHLKDSSVSLCRIVPDSLQPRLRARIDTTLASGEQYRIHLRDSLFSDIYGNFTDSLTFTLTPKDYGILTLHIDNQTGYPLCIEVLDKRDTVVQHSVTQSLSHPVTLKFSHLPAGDYRLRAVLDTNGDGRWTPGDYFLGRQPERVVFFDKTLSLREKWEMEEQWTVEKEKQKKGKEEQMRLRPASGTLELTPAPIKNE